MVFGSDLIISWLKDLGIDRATINPGASIRGIHESAAFDEDFSLYLTLHEEVAVGMAHGYWKATRRPMAVFLHDLVGLQHASMAMFNAFVDRAAMLVLGGSGPRREPLRRPWLDWIHTANSHAILARDFAKAVFEPNSLENLAWTLTRGIRTAMTPPCGPVYISIDTELQEAIASGAVSNIGLGVPVLPLSHLDPLQVTGLVAELLRSQRPAVIVDRWDGPASTEVASLAEEIGARVIDLGGGASFASEHVANYSHHAESVLAEADLIVAFEVRDVEWAVSAVDTGSRGARRIVREDCRIYAVGCGELLNMDVIVPHTYGTNVNHVIGESSKILAILLNAVRSTRSDSVVAAPRKWASERRIEPPMRIWPADSVLVAESLCRAVEAQTSSFPRLLANGNAAGVATRLWRNTATSSLLGRSGGEGLGYGLPASMGAALAHRDDDVLVVDIQADGDFLYVPSALWTAAKYELPLLVVLHNNRMYGKDFVHQREVATERERSGRHVIDGIAIDVPSVNFVALAESFGVRSSGPFFTLAEFERELNAAIEYVRLNRRPFLIEAVCEEQDKNVRIG